MKMSVDVLEGLKRAMHPQIPCDLLRSLRPLRRAPPAVRVGGGVREGCEGVQDEGREDGGRYGEVGFGGGGGWGSNWGFGSGGGNEKSGSGWGILDSL